MYCELRFHFYNRCLKHSAVKKLHKSLFDGVRGGLKSLLQLFNCIYILFKSLVKTATLLYLKTRQKQAVSEKSILGCELISLLTFTGLYLFLTRWSSAVSALSVCLMGHWMYQGVWGVVCFTVFLVGIMCLGRLLPSAARTWLCILYEVKYLSASSLRLWICNLHDDEWS